MQEKILLVDDREDNLLSIETILEQDGYHIVKANSGKQALKILLSEFDFALILMDVKMPNLDGFETAALIYEREKLRHIPIVFITAHSYGDENIFKGYRAGAVDYIYKPINPDLLRAKVSVFVELYKQNHKLLAQEQKMIAINKNLEAEIKERKISEEKIKALNLQLLQNIDKLEIANKDLDRFAFMASHDLQEPLRKIRTFGDRIVSKYNEIIDDEGKKYFERMQHAAQRMQSLIHDILTFSKISSEEKEFVECDLTVLIHEVLVEFEPIIKEINAKVEIEKLPTLQVNPGLMRPLFYNLLSNSFKYSRKDITPVIRVRTDRQHHGSNTRYCRIFFEDNGIGFDQKYADQVFRMFTRVHLDKSIDGTGIGLALCKKIVEEHNGFISAKSNVNEGATFIVSLPLVMFNKQREKSVFSFEN